MVSYIIEELTAFVDNVIFIPIEFLDWECLTIGALGWGQVQITDSNRIMVNPQNSRISWMIEFCNTMLEFYPRELAKIDKRIEYFKRIRAKWERRVD